MAHVFISHSKKDHVFAELARIKLEEAQIKVWIDHDNLGAGTDWRQGIDLAITDCSAVVLALSEHSAASSFVTYEWASAMGKSKPIIPVRLSRSELHPKLETIQSLDFSKPGRLPWSTLVERINEIETDELPEYDPAANEEAAKKANHPTIDKILKYLDQRGYQMASFDRLRMRIDESLEDEEIEELIAEHRHVVRPATLKGKRKGIARV